MFLLKQLTRPTSNEESGSSNRKWRSAWSTCSKRFIILIQRLSWQKKKTLLKAFPVSQPKTWKYLVWNVHLGEHVIEGILCKFRGLSPFKHSINSEAFLWLYMINTSDRTIFYFFASCYGFHGSFNESLFIVMKLAQVHYPKTIRLDKYNYWRWSQTPAIVSQKWPETTTAEPSYVHIH